MPLLHLCCWYSEDEVAEAVGACLEVDYFSLFLDLHETVLASEMGFKYYWKHGQGGSVVRSPGQDTDSRHNLHSYSETIHTYAPRKQANFVFLVCFSFSIWLVFVDSIHNWHPSYNSNHGDLADCLLPTLKWMCHADKNVLFSSSNTNLSNWVRGLFNNTLAQFLRTNTHCCLTRPSDECNSFSLVTPLSVLVLAHSQHF